MPWIEKTAMSQKEEFINQVLAESVPFSTLCQQFGISRTTGYAILKRFKAEGINGLSPRSRMPLSSPNKTSSELEDSILAVRKAHPTWGARKIYAYLQRQGMLGLPAPSTINGILKRHHQIDKDESLKRQALSRFEREKPNELWQMDFKGQFQLLTKQSCYPLTILDDHSRFSLCLHACRNEGLLAVKKQLIAVFEQFGLPEQINVDNGRPWGNSSLTRYTQLTVWLMQLDIRVTHSRPRHPQTNGKNERFHRTLKKDILSLTKLNNLQHAQQCFDQWRKIYNYKRPHEALAMKVPADYYQPSLRQLPTQLTTIEYQENAVIRKTNSAGYISYKSQDYLVGKAFSGYYIEIKEDQVKSMLELYFGRHRIYRYTLE